MSGSGDAAGTAEHDQACNVENSLDNLRTECETAWAQVKETQLQLKQARQPSVDSVVHTSGEQPLITILKEKERRLRAEVQVAENALLQTLPNDSQVIGASLLADLQKEVSQLKETLSLVESQQEELQSSIEKEQQYEQQLLAISEKLQERANSVTAEDTPEDTIDTITQELETKINSARKTEQKVMKRMAAFVRKHFPVPEPAQVAKTSKDLRSRKKQHSQETVPLKDILLELMTKCVESPHDPYLVLTDNHWPAYIELLLRCNIILQHPDDNCRVKLVPFHL